LNRFVLFPVRCCIAILKPFFIRELLPTLLPDKQACQPPIFLYFYLVMKTTLDLPDDLLVEAKAVAARRRITLKDMVAHALRREISPASELNTVDSERYEVGPFGILRLKKGNRTVTEEDVRDLEIDADEAEFTKAMELRGQA